MRFPRWKAQDSMKKSMKMFGVPVRGIRTETDTWKGKEWLVLVAWTNQEHESFPAMGWSFCDWDPTRWAHAICLEGR